MSNAGIHIEGGGVVDFSIAEENGGVVHFSAKDEDDTWFLGVVVVAGDGDLLGEGAGSVAQLILSTASLSFSVISPGSEDGDIVDFSVAEENGDAVHFLAKDEDDTWFLGVVVVVGDGDLLGEGAGTVAPLIFEGDLEGENENVELDGEGGAEAMATLISLLVQDRFVGSLLLFNSL